MITHGPCQAGPAKESLKLFDRSFDARDRADGLTAADADRDRVRVALQVLRGQRELHSSALACREMHTREAFQLADRIAAMPIAANVQLHDLVTRTLRGVLYACVDRGAASGSVRLETCIFERGVAQSETEAEERLRLEEAIRAAQHRVVVEGRQLSDVVIERDRQPPG